MIVLLGATFSIQTTKNIYRCFRCGSTGNVLEFWRTYRGLEFYPAAVELYQILESSNRTQTATKSSTLVQPTCENGWFLIAIDIRCCLQQVRLLGQVPRKHAFRGSIPFTGRAASPVHSSSLPFCVRFNEPVTKHAATLDTEPLAKSYPGGSRTHLSINHFQFAPDPHARWCGEDGQQ
jgi:hypothetical protein